MSLNNIDIGLSDTLQDGDHCTGDCLLLVSYETDSLEKKERKQDHHLDIPLSDEILELLMKHMSEKNLEIIEVIFRAELIRG